MDQLKQAVAAAFDNVVASGAIETAIEKQLANTITRAIEEQFSSYGDFSKAIKAKVSALVDVDLAAIDLPSYRDLVGKIIQKRVGAVMAEQFTTQLDKDMCALLSPAPETITLEKLIEQFVAAKLDYRDDLRGEAFTLHIDRDKSPSLVSAGYLDVHLDAESDVEKNRCDFHLRVRGDGEVWALTIGGTEVKNKIFMGPLFNFEKSLFQMYTAKTKLIIPPDATEDDFDTRFPGYDD